jgi:RNA-binding protein
MKGRERASLRAEAHHLDPAIHVGAQGSTPAVRQAIDDVLRTRELVKIAIGRHPDLEPRVLAGELAQSLGAEVIQVIGRKVTLYRHNPELWPRPGEDPPWRA